MQSGYDAERARSRGSMLQSGLDVDRATGRVTCRTMQIQLQVDALLFLTPLFVLEQVCWEVSFSSYEDCHHDTALHTEQMCVTPALKMVNAIHFSTQN